MQLQCCHMHPTLCPLCILKKDSMLLQWHPELMVQHLNQNFWTLNAGVCEWERNKGKSLVIPCSLCLSASIVLPLQDLWPDPVNSHFYVLIILCLLRLLIQLCSGLEEVQHKLSKLQLTKSNDQRLVPACLHVQLTYPRLVRIENSQFKPICPQWNLIYDL